MSQEIRTEADASIRAFSDSAADFLGAADQRARIHTLEPHAPGFERAMWGRIAGQGWLSILVPEQAGGLGLGLAEMAAVSEQVGRHLLAEPFIDAGVHPIALLAALPESPAHIAKALLGFERIFGGSPKHAQYTLAQLEALARQRHLFDDPAFVARFAEAQLDTADLCAAYAGFAGLVKRGETLPASVSLLKVWATETHERIALLLADSAAEYGGYREPARNDEINLHVVPPLFNALAATIFSGTNEIQRNILAKQVLGLPT